MPRPDLLIPPLRAALNGRVVAPDDPAYDQARAVFFRGFDRRPAAIVRATDATDVARVVSLARETGLGLAVRSGGHSNAGYRPPYRGDDDRPPPGGERTDGRGAAARARWGYGPRARRRDRVCPPPATDHAEHRCDVRTPRGGSGTRAWATRFAAALNQREAGAYVGFLGDEGEARVREAYPGSTWDRLTAIKRRYDPTNLFRLNQNIPSVKR